MDKKKFLPKPLPFFDPPFQSGISDPRYPLLAPPELENDQEYELYKGLVDIQDHLAIIRADVLTNDRDELKDLLNVLSRYAYEAMEKKPSHKNVMPLAHGHLPDSYRVTVTLGFGYTLFTDQTGYDRFGFVSRKPKYLKIVPGFPGDHFDPLRSASDMIIMVASDHPYINVAISRYIAEYINKDFRKLKDDYRDKTVFSVIDIQQGFGRPDRREFLRFNDGIDNLRSGIDLENLVFVDEYCGEPGWCVGGSYMVYRKIREMMPVWEAFTTKEQEHTIGRHKETGAPLSKNVEGIEKMTPVFPDHKDPKDGGPLNAHIRKVQPRRTHPDLFGMNDLDRRFLRRGYPFFEGVDHNGQAVNGLHFVAYMKSIQQQFEHVTNMWQMNPDFPVPGTGIDRLYASGVLQTIDGGYYFCPPAPKDKDDFIGSGLFKAREQQKYKIPPYIYGYGITFIDIDETVFRTFSVIRVLNDGKIVRVLSNQEFNEYILGPGETYDFGDFRNADQFLRTSLPITPVIRKIKEILNIINTRSEGSLIVFLTARSDFDDKDTFLNAFRKYGIDIDSKRMYVERSGNLPTGTVAEKKKQIVTSYLSKGLYRRVRLIDDNLVNLKEFLSIEKELPQELLNMIRKTHSLDETVKPVTFQAFLIDHGGHMNAYTSDKHDEWIFIRYEK